MTLKSPLAMYKAIASELLGNKASTLKSTKAACASLVKHVTSKGELHYIFTCTMLGRFIQCLLDYYMYTYTERKKCMKNTLLFHINALFLKQNHLSSIGAILQHHNLFSLIVYVVLVIHIIFTGYVSEGVFL